MNSLPPIIVYSSGFTKMTLTFTFVDPGYGLTIAELEISFSCRVRTSSGTFLNRGHDKIVQNIEKRIADFAFIPVGMWLRHSFFCSDGEPLINYLDLMGSHSLIV